MKAQIYLNLVNSYLPIAIINCIIKKYDWTKWTVLIQQWFSQSKTWTLLNSKIPIDVKWHHRFDIISSALEIFLQKNILQILKIQRKKMKHD